MSNRGKTVFVELTPELAEFLGASCEKNIEFGLASMKFLTSRDLQEQMVDLLEKNKQVLKAVKEAT